MSMGQVTVGPRVEFRTDHYPRLRVRDPELGEDRFVYLHRLTAYAHGLIDDLWAPVDVHHINCDGWDNRPENLEALERWEHAEKEAQVANLR